MHRPLRYALFGLLALVGPLSAAAGFMAEGFLESLFGEGQPIELLSALTWLVAAFAVLVRGRGRRRAQAFGGVLMALAMRETGLPGQLIPSGRQLMTWAYYGRVEVPLLQRMLIGLIMLALLLALLGALFVVIRYYLYGGGFGHGDGQWLFAAAVILVFSQVFEALPGWLGGKAAAPFVAVCWALEESLECAGALFALGSICMPGSGRLFCPLGRPPCLGAPERAHSVAPPG